MTNESFTESSSERHSSLKNQLMLKVATLENETVGVLQGSKLALTFHPELTNDRRFIAG